jgi:hypothetical protein
VSIEYLELRADQLTSELQVSETEIRDQYEAEVASGRFQKPEERQARHILFKLEGQDEAAVQAKAESLLQRARAGEDFATLARENSQDESTAKDGGELGWVTRDMMVAPFSEALFAMTEPKTFSEPVKSDFGLHIIELEGVRGGETQPYEEVHDALAQELKQRRADSLFYDRAEKLGQLAFENRDSLEPVAQEMGLTVQRVDGVTRQQGDGIASEDSVRTVAFGENVPRERREQRPRRARRGPCSRAARGRPHAGGTAAARGGATGDRGAAARRGCHGAHRSDRRGRTNEATRRARRWSSSRQTTRANTTRPASSAARRARRSSSRRCSPRPKPNGGAPYQGANRAR